MYIAGYSETVDLDMNQLSCLSEKGASQWEIKKIRAVYIKIQSLAAKVLK